MMAHEDYKEMLPAHALSALDASEAQALNEHLAGCAECRQELAHWENTAAALALSTPPMEPSPEVRERIMNAVRDDKGARVIPFASPRRNVWTSFGSLGAIAAVILFVALIIGIVVLWKQNRRLERENQLVQVLSEPG